MEKGIIYLMTTVVNGLIKIGKTGNDQFENRMRFLESNGYANITGLKLMDMMIRKSLSMIFLVKVELLIQNYLPWILK